MEEIESIRSWLSQETKTSTKAAAKPRIKQGYRALFNGPATNNKIATAEILGKEFNKKIYRIDLSQVVSKYIGETEKNLTAIFKKAENKSWILFLDEADALFGKRTTVKDAHDKYANQEVNYLLQKIEEYPGLSILATNLKGNIDPAFLRRFHTVLQFPKAKLV